VPGGRRRGRPRSGRPQGASVKAVQAHLGHASATITLDRYGHLFLDELSQLARHLDRAYADAITDPDRTEAAP
jgi:integrase